MKKGDQIELQIESYAFEGKGVARIDKGDPSQKFVIFVNGSYPGDRVISQITKVKKTYAEAKVVEILSHSDERIVAKCKFFGVCGGCKAQDLKYAVQVKYKEAQVIDIFKRMGGFSDFEILPIVPSEKIFHYRNKMEFSFAKRWLTEDEIKSGKEIADRSFALGLHIPKIFDKVLDITECHLCSGEFMTILNFTREFFKSRGTSIYSTDTHTGYLRNLVIKKSHGTEDLMVNLVTSEYNKPIMTEYRKELLKTVPTITTIVNNINIKKSQVAVGDYEKVEYGNGYIHDTIGEYKFRISANSFFQTNTLQAKNLYQTVLEFAEINAKEIIYDLYSGAGTIAIYISGNAEKVYAFETVVSAIADAKINLELNNVNNVEFIQADLNKSILPNSKMKKLSLPDVVITDPPRSGMHQNTVQDIIDLRPKKVVYISCNPTTQVRDIKLLVDFGYRLIKIKPVDMFPHTYHIENVALLKL
ncbi:MAG: 23S rRNA (uracil-5-)-methyltransferase RumA [Ignavibacteria bacterium RBG_13_36_8]|nr:MAG: 23S rRNA (uracil-5-)-methyltransferase RumA [Ignavibacteria bacterium RBG_13_36_8]